jgi:RNA polymerase-binding transcription factor
MNIEQYRQRLLDIERALARRIDRSTANARENFDESARDVGDASVSDELEDEQFTEADLDSTTLTEVRDALRRIDEGTYGRCVVDGEPIEEKRLEAMPWTPYCLKHQQLREAGRRAGATL